MSGGHLPRIRINAGFDSLMAREGLSLTFFLRRTHAEAAHAERAALETYVRAVGPEALGWYADGEGEFQKRVLEPWLFHNPRGAMPCFRGEDVRRWERRFLD